MIMQFALPKTNVEAEATFPSIRLFLLIRRPVLEVIVLSCVQFFVTPWTADHQAPLSMDFPGSTTGLGCHSLLQQIFPTQGLNPGLCIAGGLFTA